MTQQAHNATPLVFVVDDDIFVRTGLAALLESVGLRPEVFASAEKFLQREAADTANCLLLDVNLPGMSGLDLQAVLARGDANIPIIFLSADITKKAEAMKAGAVEFLCKPVDEQYLLDAISVALERDRARRGNRPGPNSSA